MSESFPPTYAQIDALTPAGVPMTALSATSTAAALPSPTYKPLTHRSALQHLLSPEIRFLTAWTALPTTIMSFFSGFPFPVSVAVCILCGLSLIYNTTLASLTVHERKRMRKRLAANYVYRLKPSKHVVVTDLLFGVAFCTIFTVALISALGGIYDIDIGNLDVLLGSWSLIGPLVLAHEHIGIFAITLQARRQNMAEIKAGFRASGEIGV